MHPRFERRLRPIAAVVLVFFSIYCIEPLNFAHAAQSLSQPQPSVSNKSKPAAETFEESLRGSKQAIDALDQQMATGQDTARNFLALKGYRKDMEAADKTIRAEFADTEARLKAANLPDEIQSRRRVCGELQHLQDECRGSISFGIGS